MNTLTPHLLGDIAERALASLDLFVKNLTAVRATSERVKEDVTGVLHENSAIEI